MVEAACRAVIAVSVALTCALTAGLAWPSPVRAAEAAPRASCADTAPAKGSIESFSVFGLRLCMTETEARSVIEALPRGKNCPSLSALPTLDHTCWTTVLHRESERLLPRQARTSMALRSELEGRWSALLRVYFSAPTTPAPSDAPDAGSHVYRIEWHVYWIDRDLWLLSARKKMRERVMKSVDAAVGSLRRPRQVLDHGATHRYLWQADTGDAARQKAASSITLDISYPPQMSLVVSRGEEEEIYSPRVAEWTREQAERKSEDAAVEDFLSKPAGELPRLPAP